MSDTGSDAELAPSSDNSGASLTDQQHDWATSFTGIDTRARSTQSAGSNAGQPTRTNGSRPADGDGSAADGSGAVAADGSGENAPRPLRADGDAGQADGDADQTQQPGASLVNNPQFEKWVEAMEADDDEAQSTWKSQVKDGVFGFLGPQIQAQYTADGTDCEKARDDFVVEWNKIEAGKGDPKQLEVSFDLFWLRLAALQEANARVGALIAVDFTTKLAPFLAFVMKLKKFDLAQKFKKRLEKLQADLDNAEKAVTKAEVKTALNLVVSAVTTIVAPEATLAKLLLAGGGMAAHIAIDRGLGEGSVTGTVVFVAGDAGEFVELSAHGKEVIEKLKGGSKTLGGAAAVLTAVLDINDVYEGKEKVEKIKEELDETQKAFDELMAGVLPLESDFIMLDKLIQGLPGIVNKALAAGNEAAKNYDFIKQEIQKATQGGG